jgi:hypothetical protein
MKDVILESPCRVCNGIKQKESCRDKCALLDSFQDKLRHQQLFMSAIDVSAVSYSSYRHHCGLGEDSFNAGVSE